MDDNLKIQGHKSESDSLPAEKNENPVSTSKAAKAVVWYTIGSVLLKGIAFISTPIFTRLMSKAEFGAFSNISTWYSLFSIFASMELSASMLRARTEFKNDIFRYMFSLLPFGNIITGVLYFFACIFMPQVESLIAIDAVYIHMMFITLMFAPATTLLISYLKFNYVYKLSTLITIGSSMVTIVTSLILIFASEDKLSGRAIGFFSVHCIVGLLCYAYIFYKGKKIKTSYWGYAFKISFPLVIHLLSMYILSSSDKIMIIKMCGEEANALYSLAYSCGVVLSFLWSALNSAFSPIIGDCLSSNNKEYTRKMTLPYLAIYAVPAILLMLFSPELVYIMGGSSYMEAKTAIPPVVAGSVLQYIYTLYVNIEQYEKKTWGVSMGTILAAVVNILLNYFLIPIFGYVAASYTTFISFFLLFLIHFLLVRRLKLTNYYNTKYVFLVVAVVICAMMLTLVLFNFNIIRYILLATCSIAILFVLLKNKSKILKMFR